MSHKYICVWCLVGFFAFVLIPKEGRRRRATSIIKAIIDAHDDVDELAKQYKEFVAGIDQEYFKFWLQAGDGIDELRDVATNLGDDLPSGNLTKAKVSAKIFGSKAKVAFNKGNAKRFEKFAKHMKKVKLKHILVSLGTLTAVKAGYDILTAYDTQEYHAFVGAFEQASNYKLRNNGVLTSRHIANIHITLDKLLKVAEIDGGKRAQIKLQLLVSESMFQ